MKRFVAAALVIACLGILASIILTSPVVAGDQKCMACNTYQNPQGAHGCSLGKIVRTYQWKKMGPARKSDGREDDTKIIYKALLVYSDVKCTEYIDWTGFSDIGCAGTKWQPGWPEERVVNP